MRNSGYVSVGHILASKSPDTHVETLRHFCTVVFCNVDDTQIHKSSGFWRYDQFFRSVPMSVESFAQFFGGLLRKRDSDEFMLQLELERLAWDMLKFDYDKFTCPAMVRRSLFQVFCLFNRFCSFGTVPMTLPENALTFLLQEMKLPFSEEASLQDWTFERLLMFVCGNKEHFEPRLLKRLYDTYVRDVLKEGRLRCRPMTSGGLLSSSSSSDKTKKIVSVTSRELVVYDDDNGDLDQPSVSEPTGRVLHRLPLIDAETKVVKAGFRAKARTLLQITSEAKDAPNLELIFDASTENYNLFSWNQAVQEAAYSTQAMQDRLSKAHLRLGFAGIRRDDQTRMSSVSDEGKDNAKVKKVKAIPVPAPRGVAQIKRSSSELVLSTLFGGVRDRKGSEETTEKDKQRRASPRPIPPPAFLKGRKKQVDLADLRKALDSKNVISKANSDSSSGDEMVTAESWKPLRKDSCEPTRAF